MKSLFAFAVIAALSACGGGGSETPGSEEAQSKGCSVVAGAPAPCGMPCTYDPLNPSSCK